MSHYEQWKETTKMSITEQNNAAILRTSLNAKGQYKGRVNILIEIPSTV